MSQDLVVFVIAVAVLAIVGIAHRYAGRPATRAACRAHR